MKKICVYAVLFLMLVLAGACGKEKRGKPPEIGIRESLPKYIKFRYKIRLQGNIEPKEYALICARTDGAIDIMKVDEGFQVKKGDLLFQTDKLNLESLVEVSRKTLKVEESRVKEAEANFTLSQAKLEKAEKDHQRYQKLFKVHAISEEVLERKELEWKEAKLNMKIAETTVNSAETKVEQARSNLAIAQKYYDDSLVKAPFDGVVTHRYKEMGEYAQKADCILRLENPEVLELSLLLSSKYYPLIVPGKTMAVIYSELGKKLKEIAVTYKSPTVDPDSRTFEIKIDLPEKNSFVSGMLCDVDLILSEHMAYGVPNDALLLRGDGRNIVFTVKDGKAAEAVVEKGITEKGFTELKDVNKSNIFPIVTEGQAFLSEGSPVNVIKANGKKAGD